MSEIKGKSVLFIDRDGTLVVEPPVDYQLDSLEKLEFIPKVFKNMNFIANTLDYELVMVTNQDGLGTESFPEETFHPAHNKMLQAFANEGVEFDDIIIDRTFEYENAPTRKPRTALLTNYINSEEYDMSSSFVIGDRLTDVQLAKNLGAKAILLQERETGEAMLSETDLADVTALITNDWDKVAEFLRADTRIAEVVRKTNETDIYIRVDIDGNGKSDISTGLGFFDHMLDQISRHSGINLTVKVKGDTYVDEHHTIEDTGIALGDALRMAIGNKRGMERYGYVLPMDDCLCSVSIDFGGRSWLQWDAEFKRERIGEMPTEMFMHFFKSLSDSARMNLAISATGDNEHHKIEGIFKGLARAIKMAIHRDIFKYELPSTKGVL